MTFRTVRRSLPLVFLVGLGVAGEEPVARKRPVPRAADTQAEAPAGKGEKTDAAEKDAAEKPAAPPHKQAVMQALIRRKSASDKEGAAKNAAADRKREVQERALRLQEKARAAQIEQRVIQIQQQYQPFLNAELRFLRQVCDLAPADRRQVRAAGEHGLKLAAQQMGGMMVGRQRGGTMHPRQIIQTELVEALQTILPQPEMERLRSELSQRNDRRRDTAIDCVVAKMDSVLFLTAEQRDRLADKINKQWNPAWEQWIMMYQYGDQYFPEVPNACVAGILNKDQQTVWNGLQKVTFGFHEHDPGLAADDEAWWSGQ